MDDEKVLSDSDCEDNLFFEVERAGHSFAVMNQHHRKTDFDVNTVGLYN